MILNCAIVDDEPLALELLRSYVEKTSFLRLVGRYSSAVQAMTEIPLREEVHVLFLDIQMPELNGFGVFTHGQSRNKDYFYYCIRTVCLG